MAVLIRAAIDRWSGFVRLRFSYDPATVEAVKEIPGARWDKPNTCWWMSQHGWDVLKPRFKYTEEALDLQLRSTAHAQPPDVIAQRLRDYQLYATNFLLSRSGALLTMEMRTGKTPAAIAAIAGAFSAGSVSAAFIAYPASIMENWRAELKQWAGLDLLSLESYDDLTQDEIEVARSNPYLVVGCHYEIIAQREDDIHRLLAGKAYVALADELHHCKNRKAPRTLALKRVGSAYETVTISTKRDPSEDDNARAVSAGYCIARWGLTGTPMRNRNRDLFGLFDWIAPNSMGGYWTFAKRYADAHINERGHWEDKGNSNDTELNERLAAVSFKVTRAQVAAHLPKSDRKVISCSMPRPLMKKYQALEKAYAKGIAKTMNDSSTDESGLRQLALATVGAKIPTAVERAYDYAEQGMKVLCFAYNHESLQKLEESFDNTLAADKDASNDNQSYLPPHFCAGGWKTPAKRHEIIEQWRACPGPAILLCNTISSGVGIDLADAAVAIFIELAWVPADFRQAEDRIQDVHKGKRTTPPVYEYLITKDTIDEAMAAKLLEKIRNIESVVGDDVESAGVAKALRDGNVVNSGRLGLSDTSHDTVMAAIASIRDRWLSDEPDDRTEGEKLQEKLMAAASSLEDDEPESSDDGLSMEVA